MKEIVKFIHGSYLYGTNTETSDKDYCSVLIPSVEEILESKIGLTTIEPTHEICEGKENCDHTRFDIFDFFHRAMRASPTVVEWLFIPKDKIITSCWQWEKIIEYRDSFLSKRVYQSFLGYSYSEEKAIFLQSPHMGDKRKKQFEQFGYSPKNAMNCVRLLQQGIELLDTKTITFPRTNSEFLKEIKNGIANINSIKSLIGNLRKDLQHSFEDSELPDKSNEKVCKYLCLYLITGYMTYEELFLSELYHTKGINFYNLADSKRFLIGLQ